MTLNELYEQLQECQACSLRNSCLQVVTHDGQTENPILVIVGEAPGSDEDEVGKPFVGRPGQLLRQVLRDTKIINRENTLITNTIHCRPPGNKFPTDDRPSICTSRWLLKELQIAKPELMLLLGSQALWYVAGMEKITQVRGNWVTAQGVRTMVTLHPSYVLRKENSHDPTAMASFCSDIMEVAKEVEAIEAQRKLTGGRARGQD